MPCHDRSSPRPPLVPSPPFLGTPELLPSADHEFVVRWSSAASTATITVDVRSATFDLA